MANVYILTGRSEPADSFEDTGHTVLGVFDHEPTLDELSVIRTKLVHKDINGREYLLHSVFELETWETNSVEADVVDLKTVFLPGANRRTKNT